MRKKKYEEKYILLIRINLIQEKAHSLITDYDYS